MSLVVSTISYFTSALQIESLRETTNLWKYHLSVHAQKLNGKCEICNPCVVISIVSLETH